MIERKIKKEIKKEKKERKKERRARNGDNKDDKYGNRQLDKEHPMSILCAGSTQREQQQRRKKCQNKLRTSRETGAETDGPQRESFPQSNQNKEH